MFAISTIVFYEIANEDYISLIDGNKNDKITVESLVKYFF